jgi:hypothetical protein
MSVIEVSCRMRTPTSNKIGASSTECPCTHFHSLSATCSNTFNRIAESKKFHKAAERAIDHHVKLPTEQTRHAKPASLASPRHGRRSTHGQRLRRHAVHQRHRCQISRRCRRLKPLGGIGTEPNYRWCAAYGGTCVGSSGRVDSGEAGSENVNGTRGTD